MRFVFVRHGESIWNAENRWQGQSDIALSERGRREAREVAPRLAAIDDVVAVYASDLERARDTAAPAAAALGHEVRLEPGVREMNLGAWCGLPHHEVIERFGAELAGVMSGASDVRVGGTGESMREFEGRVLDAVSRIAERHTEGTVLVFTHGGVVRALMQDALGLTRSQGASRRRPLEGARNTSLSTFVRDGHELWLAAYNDLSHLEHDASYAPLDLDELEELHADRARDSLLELFEVPAEASARVLAPSAGSRTRVRARHRRLFEYGVGAPR